MKRVLDAGEVGSVVPAEVGEEQAADLAYLSRQIGDEPLPGEELAPDEAPAVDAAQQWAMIPAMLGSALAIAMPELQRVYSREACEAWGAAMVPVADKYGWNADGLVGPELALLAASLPLAIGTYGAIKAKRAELVQAEHGKAAAPAAPSAGDYQEPGAKTVVIGAALEGGE